MEKEARSRYFDVIPGDGINYSINKSLCGQFAQGALDSQHKTCNNLGSEETSPTYEYVFELPLDRKESKFLEKDLLNYTVLEDILDVRKCRAFVIIATLRLPRKYYVCRLKDWHLEVRKRCGFDNLYFCTDVRGFTRLMGDLAGAMNFGNIITEFEKRHDNTDLTIILLNCYFLNEGKSMSAINRYGLTNRRSFLSRVAFEKTQKNLEMSKAAGLCDDLTENYVRIMLQTDPLIGTNFSGFQLVNDAAK